MKPSYPYQVYGRRYGRNWKSDYQTLLETEPFFLKVNREGTCFPHSLFEKAKSEYWLEIGFGYGEHLATLAERNPEKGFIGAEVYLDGVAACALKVKEKALSNVRLAAGDARPLLDSLSSQSLDCIVLLFPDPWPKRRHKKRQMFGMPFVQHLQKLLKVGGVFRFASDVSEYAEEVFAVLRQHPHFKLMLDCCSPERPSEESWPATRYERKARQQDKKCQYLEFIKV